MRLESIQQKVDALYGMIPTLSDTELSGIEEMITTFTEELLRSQYKNLEELVIKAAR